MCSRPSSRRFVFALITVLWAVNVAMSQEPKLKVPDTLDKDYAAELPRSTPLSPEEALKSFEIASGFKLELVAAEPLVTDPIAICFDENSRMYVVEMRGYSEERDQKLSRIRLLEDTDGDGKYEKSTIFADGLLWPTAIHCWKGGVFVADAPDLFYLKDTNGDGVADEKEVQFSGFGTSNVQGLVNTLQWSFDNRIYGAVSSSGAAFLKVDPFKGPAAPLTLRGRDFAYDERRGDLQAISGGGQHGATFDLWGDRFVCSNSDHIQHIVFEDECLAKNSYFAPPAARRSIAADGPQADVFRISPLEPWRVVRTRLRVNKIVPGIVEGGGRPAGYFTGATGVTIYNGDAWPAEHLGLAFVGDVGSNLVHRKRLRANGVSFVAERIDEKKEVVASRDTWFRPVQFANAPDGCLYICDMYRETIEHPASIPPILKKHLDLTSGRDRGRIYRVVHEQSALRPKLPRLGSATTAELVQLLEHPNGWHRETAARLLYERQASAARPLLKKLVRESKSPHARILASYGLQTIEADLDEAVFDGITEELLLGLRDEHPRVREHALRQAGRFALLPNRGRELRAAVEKLAADPDPRIRFRAAFAVRQWSVDERLPVLLTILRQDVANPDIRAAVQTSLQTGSGQLLAQLAGDEKLIATAGGQDLARSLITQIGKQQEPADIAFLVKTLADWSQQKSALLPVAIQSLNARQGSPLALQIATATGGKADEWLQDLIDKAVATAKNEQAAIPARLSALKQLRLARFVAVKSLASELLSPTQPVDLQAETIALLAGFETNEAAQVLLARFEQLTPATKSRALDALLARDNWARSLLKKIEDQTIPASELDQTRWTLLSESPHAEVRERAIALAAANQQRDRLEVVAWYRPVLETAGDATRGKEVFKKNCAACHKLQGTGHEIGPNLAAMKNRGPEAILVNVLDPNREVNPQYLNYLLLTADGRSLSGILTGETATSVTLKKQENATEVILRVDIESLKSTGQSLMPVGMEKQIDKAAMADLLEYLKSVE